MSGAYGNVEANHGLSLKLLNLRGECKCCLNVKYFKLKTFKCNIVDEFLILMTK